MSTFNIKDFADALRKAGARHGVKDRMALQKAHDAVSEMVECAFCQKASTTKANARHSRSDMDRLEKVHTLLCELGADCAGKAQDSENLPMGMMPDAE